MASEQQGGILKLMPLPHAAQSPKIYPLSTLQEVVVGRAPDCQVILDSHNYRGVSRRHAAVQPLPGLAEPAWQICDLGSANGTFINGQRLHHCHRLQAGDQIVLGQDGPQFIFEQQAAATIVSPFANPPQEVRDQPTLPAAPVAHSTPSAGSPPIVPMHTPVPMPVAAINSDLSVSQLLPIVSTRKDLLKKGYLIPGVLTVVLVVSLFATSASPTLFNILLATYLGGGAFFFIYRLCGKTKPWWTIVVSALLTIVLLVSPVLSLFIFVFRVILPGGQPAASAGFLPQLISNFFGAGLMEELLKALPVLFFVWLGNQLRPPKRQMVGVWEPLDGILLASASALGFTWLETLGQYVPNVMQEVAQQAGAAAGDLVGLQLLIPRILGSVAGHMAYSGYLGYFIGLSILKPSKRWQILGIGYFTASLLHAFWNASAVGLRNQFGPLVGVVGLMLVGVVSYAFLTAAILKARQLSPTRAKNFATRIAPPS